MPSMLHQSQTCSEMSDLLSSFLPGSGSSQWTAHVTFASVAESVGVANFWQGGGKSRSLSTLLDLTLTNRRAAFEPLILTIVREGLHYRRKRGQPVTRGEIVRLHELLRRVEFQFPSLLDPTFLAGLPDGNPSRVDETQGQHQPSSIQPRLADSHDHMRLEELRNNLYRLHLLKDRQRAGFDLERLLNATFDLFGMSPRSPFKLKGEQIDGSFELDNEIYLVEAKWKHQPTQIGELLIFQGKIEAKSDYTRGVFFTMSGVSNQVQAKFTEGRRSRFIVVDGYDLTTVLEGQVTLDALLRAKKRKLAEEGRIMISVKALLNQ